MARQQRRQAERKWRKTRLDSDRKLFLEQNDHVNKVISVAKMDYFQEKLSSCNSKEVYRIIYSLLNKKSGHLPIHDSASFLSSQFSLFFVEKIRKIREDIDAYNVVPDTRFVDSVDEVIPLFENFQSYTQPDVSKLIMNSTNTSCMLDPIPTWLLKENLTQLLPLITDIINISLSTGRFPLGAHSAIVRPLLKKPNLDQNELSNYRPVSNLSFLGKLIEKAACSQLIQHIENNCMFDPVQSAYRSHHSTESALVKVKNDIMFSLDSNEVVLIALLDLSAAFDTIDHKILLSRLYSRIGVRSTALSWFESYLTGWSSRVSIAGELSKPTNLDFGLPQGSIVGPIGYSIYTLPVGNIIRHHCINYHLYADDTQLYISFNPKIPGDLVVALYRLQSCISDIRNWMLVNKLKLKDAKTEFFIAASPHSLRSLPDLKLKVGDLSISPSVTVKNLGVIFDKEMSMSDRVSQICTTVTFHLRNISRIRRYITQSACNNAISSLVLSRLDYCNGLLSTIPVTQLDRIQRLQNWAARLIYQVTRSHSPKPLLDSLHWLPVRHRIVFKLLLLVFKSLNKQAPQYLRDCLTLYTPRRYVRASSDPLRLT